MANPPAERLRVGAGQMVRWHLPSVVTKNYFVLCSGNHKVGARVIGRFANIANKLLHHIVAARVAENYEIAMETFINSVSTGLPPP
jgi:hypothetical protein